MGSQIIRGNPAPRANPPGRLTSNGLHPWSNWIAFLYEIDQSTPTLVAFAPLVPGAPENFVFDVLLFGQDYPTAIKSMSFNATTNTLINLRINACLGLPKATVPEIVPSATVVFQSKAVCTVNNTVTNVVGYLASANCTIVALANSHVAIEATFQSGSVAGPQAHLAPAVPGPGTVFRLPIVLAASDYTAAMKANGNVIDGTIVPGLTHTYTVVGLYQRVA